MFTGIISDIGTITAKAPVASGTRFTIRTAYETATIALGASIACSGICLTVTEKTADSFSVEASPETLSLTTASAWQVGTKLNLERALKAGDELGGHIVSGHVDGLGAITQLLQEGDFWRLDVAVPPVLAPFVAAKGSITMDGISLTINRVEDTAEGTIISLMIIPHTWQNTTLHQRDNGDSVNLEIDMLARYMQRMIAYQNPV